MITVGVVKDVDGPMARVMVESGPSCCEQCVKEKCDINTGGVETEAFNPVHARIGQKVRIEMKAVTYLKGAFILYVVPVFALFLGAILGEAYLPSYVPGKDPDLLSAAGGFFLFLISLVFVKLLASRMGRKTENRSVIQSIIE